MRPKRVSRRGRAISILAAAGLGYTIGSWNAGTVQSAEPPGRLTAAQAVALRFPATMSNAPAVLARAVARPVTVAAAADPALVLFEPEPMAPPQEEVAETETEPVPEQTAAVPQAQSQPMTATGPTQTASLEIADNSPSEETADLVSVEPSESAPTAVARVSPMPSEAAAGKEPTGAARVAKHRGYFLDDAQIAGIKRRLHLTPDQESMWPAVAAALHNIGLQRLRQERRRGAAEAIDPNSPEVQDLKSAAIPLIMSFTERQRDEVRNLAHVMGLDQLASEF